MKYGAGATIRATYLAMYIFLALTEESCLGLGFSYRSIRPLNMNAAAVAVPIRRVAIVGAGPAGLCMAASLRRLTTNPVVKCVVFEGRDDALQPLLGGGLQLTGGCAVIEKLGLLPEIEKIAHPLARVLARNRFGEELLNLDVNAAVRERAKERLCSNFGLGAPMLYSITREALQKILYDAAVSNGFDDFVTVIPKKSLVGIERTLGNNREESFSLAFTDGSCYDNFDMIIGADGVNSVVRSFANLDNPLFQGLPSFLSKGFKAYTGIRITYGITGVDNSFKIRPNGGENTFHQWFGDGCYCLCASYGGLKGIQHMLAFVYRDDFEGKLGENPGWETTADLKKKLAERIKSGGLDGNTDIQMLLDACELDRFVDLSVRDRIVPLQRWSSDDGKIVLIGDSAHAMAPFLGQGANQALQDAFVLANEIQAVNKRNEVNNKSANAARNYERKRKFGTANLSIKSNFLGSLETLSGSIGGLIRDVFFKVVGKLGIAEFIFLDGASPKI